MRSGWQTVREFYSPSNARELLCAQRTPPEHAEAPQPPEGPSTSTSENKVTLWIQDHEPFGGLSRLLLHCSRQPNRISTQSQGHEQLDYPQPIRVSRRISCPCGFSCPICPVGDMGEEAKGVGRYAAGFTATNCAVPSCSMRRSALLFPGVRPHNNVLNSRILPQIERFLAKTVPIVRRCWSMHVG